MIGVDEIHSVGTALQFGAWALAVRGLAFALFESWPAQEFHAWLMARDARRRNASGRFDVLRWELRERREWQPDAARGDQLSAGRALSRAEMEARQVEFERLRSASRLLRAMLYGLSCMFCHGAAAALVLWLCTRGVGWQMVPAAVAYGAAAMFVAARKSDQHGERPARGGCNG